MTELSGWRPTPPSLLHVRRVACMAGTWGSGHSIQMGQKRLPRAALPEGGVYGERVLVFWLHFLHYLPQKRPWLEGTSSRGLSDPPASTRLRVSSCLLTAALGAAVGHSVGLALPAAGGPAGCGDRQGLGRGLPPLLP